MKRIRLFRRRPAPRRMSLALSAAHRGLTLLEIMIVIAILGLVMGLVVVPKVMDMFSKSKVDIAKLAADKFAYESYPQWKVANPSKDCPESLLALAQFVGKSQSDVEDPWGTPYEMFCGKDSMPAGATSGFALLSYGPDKKKGTEDDIKSWEKNK